MSAEPTTYSIGLRLRRIVVEDAFIAVPVTDRIMQVDHDGTHRIDPEKFASEAQRIGADPRVEWRAEEVTIEPHPLQTPRPADRASLDPLSEEAGELGAS